MPSYKVMSPGFSDGRLYDPDGKRPILYRDKPFPKGEQPSWLEPIKNETAGRKKKRVAAEKAKADADADQVREGREDVNALSFMEGGEAVETL